MLGVFLSFLFDRLRVLSHVTGLEQSEPSIRRSRHFDLAPGLGC